MNTWWISENQLQPNKTQEKMLREFLENKGVKEKKKKKK